MIYEEEVQRSAGLNLKVYDSLCAAIKAGGNCVLGQRWQVDAVQGGCHKVDERRAVRMRYKAEARGESLSTRALGCQSWPYKTEEGSRRLSPMLHLISEAKGARRLPCA